MLHCWRYSNYVIEDVLEVRLTRHATLQPLLFEATKTLEERSAGVMNKLVGVDFWKDVGV